MNKITTPRGTQDILPPDSELWQYLENIIREVAQDFCYQEIRTPIIEHSELFQRGVGIETDIVTKEMYTFEDKGGRTLTLRPEGTAPVARAFIQHNLESNGLPQKLYYIGPMFRYERPQAGRYRQHHQFGFEVLGGKEPGLDVEVITIAITIFKRIGISQFKVLLNSIGCSECRPQFLENLRAYLRPFLPQLCVDCQRRVETNPMRVLDCKNPSCQAILNNAPSPVSWLCEECQEHFQEVQRLLGFLNYPFEIAHRLVRGLDYYTRTVFEVVSPELGAQNSLCGGGRYDNLIEAIGGPPTPGVGFAGGIERAFLILKSREIRPFPKIRVFLAYQERAFETALSILRDLRENGISADMLYESKSLSSQLKTANRRGFPFAVILGEEELRTETFVLKDMSSGEQKTLPYSRLLATFKEMA
ncbi:MAG: histidine--tRNA ligase [Caldiserica bacterium]|jgi:histidyl-tRNA synthetase|nr:histidine--tRNA ligase [Caldisericota bacterium]